MSHDLIDVAEMRFLFGGVAEVGHDIGATAFDFASPGNQDTRFRTIPQQVPSITAYFSTVNRLMRSWNWAA